MTWLLRLLRPQRLEAQLDAELRFHFDSQVADKIRAGITPAQARRITRLEFGTLDHIKEDCRERRGTLWLPSILQDLRFAARLLTRAPGFSLTAILVLALGIGVGTLAFSAYNLIALQPLPIRDPASLVQLERRSPDNAAPGLPYASIAFYRDHAHTLAAVLATFTSAPLPLNHDEPRVTPTFVTANYFADLGATPTLGRLFDPIRDSSPTAPPVAILSYRLWQNRFAANPAVLNSTIYLAGKPATVLGITSPTFANLGTDTPDLWLPIAQHPYFFPGAKPLADPTSDALIRTWARLAPNVTSAQASQELLALTNQLRPQYPTLIWPNEHILLTPGAHFVSLEDGAPLLALLAVLVILILAVACANLGGLLMARGATRQREIRLRFDLGARRSRVFRQLLTESLLLGLLGSLAALPLSYAVLRLALLYAQAPAWMSATPDLRVLAVTIAMGLLASLLFGLMPILQMLGERRSKQQTTRWQQLVIAIQVAASCVLLILAGLLVRATLHTLYTDPGFGYEQVFALDPALADHGYTPATARPYLDQFAARLRTLPGVTSVSLALYPPLVNSDVAIMGFRIDGHLIKTYPNWVSPDFFFSMAIPLLRGRTMLPNETNVVVLSQSLARKRWPTEDPIGKQWTATGDTVIGIVGNTRAMELNNSDATEIYYPLAPNRLPGMSLLIRTSGSANTLASNDGITPNAAPITLAPTIKSIASTLDPHILPTITPLTTGFRKSLSQIEQVATIISLLGSIAIFLAVVGLLGLVTYAVSQRAKEIAIRLALGATRANILSAVLRRFTSPVLLGLIVGIALTAALSQLLRRGLYGLSSLDPLSYLTAITLLLAILVTAAALPIRRALRLNLSKLLHVD